MLSRDTFPQHIFQYSKAEDIVQSLTTVREEGPPELS